MAFYSQGVGILGIKPEDITALEARSIARGSGVWSTYIAENPGNQITHLRELPEFAKITELAKVWRKLDEFLPEEFITDLETTCPNMTPAQWLEYLAGKDMHTELEKGAADRVTFITAHAAKGLEWDVVYVIGFDQGEFPKQKSVSEKRLEEERRLAYVAFTRARKRLVLCYEKEQSQFIKEAGL
jgi:superfamily I DNA/RNA helicase